MSWDVILWIYIFGPGHSRPVLQQDLQFDILEFFAGNGNLSKCMRYAGYATGSLDIIYSGTRNPNRVYRSNPMDMNSPSGFWSHGSTISRCFLVVGLES